MICPYDRDLYKERNLIKRFFAKLKQFRSVATRYDKPLVNFMGFVKLAASVKSSLRPRTLRAQAIYDCLRRPQKQTRLALKQATSPRGHPHNSVTCHSPK